MKRDRFPWRARRLDALACCACVLLAVQACGSRETRSVHMPLTLGNRWVYDVVADSVRDTAVLEVVAEEAEVFSLSARCTTGHWSEPASGLLYLRCLDSALWLQDTLPKSTRVEWRELISDDRTRSSTQSLLLFRKRDHCRFETQDIGRFVAGGDTYEDCVRLHCRYVESWFALFAGGDDSVEAEEVYCPGVGLVSFSKEHHRSGFFLLFGLVAWDDTCYDRWQLRSYHVADE
ncbi:hypothetical protein FJY69_03745 [candidate division WOR-3 bacterium]|nr:hypothetical protein [candidate division WOR-3 bacterium]